MTKQRTKQSKTNIRALLFKTCILKFCFIQVSEKLVVTQCFKGQLMLRLQHLDPARKKYYYYISVILHGTNRRGLAEVMKNSILFLLCSQEGKELGSLLCYDSQNVLAQNLGALLLESELSRINLLFTATESNSEKEKSITCIDPISVS